MNTTCKKCPALRGDTFCDHYKKDVWREDEMCETGYDLRIKKGVDMICSLEYGDPKIDKIMEQINELDALWSEMGKGQPKSDVVKPVPKPVIKQPCHNSVESIFDDIPF